MPIACKFSDAQIKKDILSGKYINMHMHSRLKRCFFSEKMMRGFIKINVETLKNNEFINFMHYFKDYIDQANPIDNKSLQSLFRKLHRGFDMFVDPQENKVESLTVFFDLMKSMAEMDGSQLTGLIHDWTILLAQRVSLFKGLLKKMTASSSNELHAALIHFLDTLQQGITNREILTNGYLQINTMLDELTKACISQDKCEVISVLDKSFIILGNMGRELDEIPSSRYAASSVLSKVLDIKGAAARRLTPEELRPIVSSFFHQRYLGQNASFIATECQKHFQLSDCGFLETSTVMDSPTTLAFNPMDSLSTPAWEDELVSSIILGDNTTAISSNASLSEGGNQTSSLPPQFSYAHPMLIRGFSALGLGVFSGLFDETSQLLLRIAENKGCSLYSRRFLAVTLAVAHSFAIATFPLMDAVVSVLANEEDATLNSRQVMISSFTFLTALVFQGTKCGLHYLSRNYLDERPITRFFVNLLPFWGGLWLLANGEEGFFEDFALIGLHILGAILSKAVIVGSAGIRSCFFSYFPSRENYRSYGTELTLLEESPVGSEEQSQRGSSDTQGSETVLSLPDPSKVCYFITPGNFNELKYQASKINEVLPLISADLSRKDRELFDPVIKPFSELVVCLEDARHAGACKHFSCAKEMVHSPDVERLLALFSVIKRNLSEGVCPSVQQVKGLGKVTKEALFNPSPEELKVASCDEKCGCAIQLIRFMEGTIATVSRGYDTKKAGCSGKEQDNSTSLRDNRNRNRRPNTLCLPLNRHDNDSCLSGEMTPLSSKPTF